jgi:hypothetical protein
MKIPFQQIDWNTITENETTGSKSSALSRVVEIDGLRVRILQYEEGYLADHWCQKGHVVHCLEGSVETQMENGEKYLLKKGMTYVVSDGMSSHRSYSPGGARLLVVDGEFLK